MMRVLSGVLLVLLLSGCSNLTLQLHFQLATVELRQ